MPTPIDDFADGPRLDGPGAGGFAVTPSDSNTLSHITRALYVGSGGDVKVDFQLGGTGITLSAVPTGTMLPIRVTKVYATGTTASGIVGIY